ncbi:MAG: hypothetical protein ACLTYD_08270, partial [Oscillospiraceae bacterium]
MDEEREFQSIKLILWRNPKVSARWFQSAKLALWGRNYEQNHIGGCKMSTNISKKKRDDLLDKIK